MTKKPKLISSIRAKLVSAVAMLLVAMIMVVSSTYAWFTLSTAPEVTGITTQIGANGALEMALLPPSGLVSDITSTVGDSVKVATEKNITWGNLVDLSQDYGLDQITLYPSVLNEENGKIKASIVKFPTYGSDGRPSELVESAVYGPWDDGEKGFIPGDTFGVRGVGSASGMTPRQLSYRNARSDANTAKDLAKKQASQSLNSKGSTLADIAIAHGLGNDVFYKEDVEAIGAIITDLEGVAAQIESAYMQYILAYAASSKGSEAAWSAISGEIEKTGASLDSVLALIESNSVTLPSELSTAIDAYEVMLADIAAAKTEYDKITSDGTDDNGVATYSWDKISPAMQPLVDVNAIQVNGIKASEVKEKMSDLVDSVMKNSGLTVTMATGGGVYADIADQCGDYSAEIKISRVSYNGIELKDTPAKMNTATTVKPPYLTAIGTVVEGAGAPSSTGETMPITEFYGYILDLAFRTNAAESSLLLQTDATDRIYADNANDETRGHGSTMTFTAPDTNFTEKMVKSLMENLRVVFFDPTDGTILASAKLDKTKFKPVVDADGNNAIEAPLYLFEVVDTFTYSSDDANIVEVYGGEEDADGNPVYYSDLACKTVATIPEGTTPTKAEKGTDRLMNAKDDVNEIVPLTQNQASRVSVLVYLDGENVGNDDVSATQNLSLKGTMNLQFASSANLVPMEYANLHTEGESYEVTVPTGVTGEATAVAKKEYTFTVADGYTLGTVTVGGTAVTPTNNNDGTYTIPADNVTGAIVINVTGSGS